MDLESTPATEPEPAPELVGVLPRTLGIRNLRKANAKGEVVLEIAGVYGGNSANVWIASFADTNEAQAFILASNYMGQMVRGIVMPDIPLIATEESTDGAGVPSREQPDPTSQGD